jgi:UbiA prenyltransferase family
LIQSDTIYACQDKRDDVKAGVKSTAILFGAYIKPILATFASALVVSLWVAGQMNNMGIYYNAISVGGGALYLALDMLTVDLDSPKSCWASVRCLRPRTALSNSLFVTVPSKWFPIRWPCVGRCSSRLYYFFVILSAAICVTMSMLEELLPVCYMCIASISMISFPFSTIVQVGLTR